MKRLLKLSFLTAAMVISAASFAQEPRKMLGGSFDLKAAVLDPTPLGPPSQFEPPPAATSAAGTTVTEKPEAKPTAAASQASAPRKTVSSKPRQKPAVAARKPPRKSPLDSYATDTRRQTWPCSGGGICTWSQQR